jgi:hypothetical protein
MLRNILAAGSKIHSGVQEIELLIDRSVDFLEFCSQQAGFLMHTDPEFSF